MSGIFSMHPQASASAARSGKVHMAKSGLNSVIYVSIVLNMVRASVRFCLTVVPVSCARYAPMIGEPIRLPSEPAIWAVLLPAMPFLRNSPTGLMARVLPIQFTTSILLVDMIVPSARVVSLYLANRIPNSKRPPRGPTMKPVGNSYIC